MNEQRARLEKIAPTVEEAIASGLEELNLSENQVEVEVLDEGGRGLFGLGSRQARVRLTVKSDDLSASRADSAVKESRPAHTSAPSRPRRSTKPEDVENSLEIARATVAEILEKMKMRAKVSAHLGESDDPRYPPPVVVDITGDDLSILIGRRAETLNALQFITRMIVGKELGRSVHIIVDVEGYRQRRERNLRQLAQRMASQAIKSGRRQVLEPMSPAERRIIHLELHDHPEVSTESVGDEPRRKVTIIPD